MDKLPHPNSNLAWRPRKGPERISSFKYTSDEIGTGINLTEIVNGIRLFQMAGSFSKMKCKICDFSFNVHPAARDRGVSHSGVINRKV